MRGDEMHTRPADQWISVERSVQQVQGSGINPCSWVIWVDAESLHLLHCGVDRLSKAIAPAGDSIKVSGRS